MKAKFKNYLQKNRMRSIKLAYWLNKISAWFSVASNRIISVLNEQVSDHESIWFVLNRQQLHKKIDAILLRQKKEYPHYSYFHGYPYQGLGILGVFGERPTEERYEAYHLEKYLNQDSKILDLGCNCGFVGIYTALRKGCQVTGIDINPYMIEIGQACADYLKLTDKVTLQACKVQDLDLNKKFNSVFSFATHWTDDANYRVNLYDHLKMIHNILEPGGLLFFESHNADVGNADFYATIKQAEQELYQKVFSRDTDANTRHYYVLQKI